MINSVSFNGYSHPIKTMWKRGKLANVTKGLYGETLTKQNLSAEHLLPVSKGGKTTLGNIALASTYMNNLRGTRPLNEVVTKQMAWDYISEFVNDKRKVVQLYIKEVYQTFKELGVL